MKGNEYLAMSRFDSFRLVNQARIMGTKLVTMIVVKKKSILNNQPAAGAEHFLLGCPNATFGRFAPKPYICNVWPSARITSD